VKLRRIYSESNHTWTVNCTEQDSHTNQPDARIFRKDTTPPLISLNHPDNGSYLDFNSEYISLNFTSIDAQESNLTCNITIDSVVNVSYINATNSTMHNESISGFSVATHFWNVTCWDRLNNTNTSITFEFTTSLPDLSINFSGILFNVTSPQENETIKINATVYNLENISTTNIIVSFFDGDPDSGGTQINGNQTISSIQGLDSEIASVEWKADIATSEIFVIVDPPLSSDGAINESNETNNKASRNITVGGWEQFYGHIMTESSYELGDNSSSLLLNWTSENFNNGSIYVSDSESTIMWNSIQALGKDINDDNTTNDFTDIDTILNMTNFVDSVYKTYTNSGNIKNFSKYIIFNKEIDEVPVADSINNSNFVTGIFWDTSDDSDGEFSQDDQEDLIFAAKVRKDSPGAFGTYDYELRVPARLRQYKQSDLSSVVFYAEIF
jgi:hypothetical protein